MTVDATITGTFAFLGFGKLTFLDRDNKNNRVDTNIRTYPWIVHWILNCFHINANLQITALHTLHTHTFYVNNGNRATWTNIQSWKLCVKNSELFKQYHSIRRGSDEGILKVNFLAEKILFP